jgi:glycolate oxidase FAD binding subunit
MGDPRAENALRALGSALGARRVRERAPLDVDGLAIAHEVEPRSADEVSQCTRALAEAGGAAIVRGGGNRIGIGNPPARADVVLSTRALAGIEELDSEDGVCRARAGTQLTELRAAANAAGWELPFDAPGEGATLGGVLAAAEPGPRAQGYGAPRDVVLGLDVVLGSGVITRCGARVVKNVTGYDLQKLYTGSRGALGVITAAWIRLRARPERVCVLAGELGVGDEASALAISAARRTTCRAALLAHAGDARAVVQSLVLELAGSEAAVERDARELARELGLRAADVRALDALRRRSLAHNAALAARVPLLPAQLAAAQRALCATGAASVAWLGQGFALAEWSPSARERAGDAEIARVCAELARAARGAAVMRRAPPDWKRERDVFGLSAGEVALTRGVKQRFDPARVLAPGRLAGRA